MTHVVELEKRTCPFEVVAVQIIIDPFPSAHGASWYSEMAMKIEVLCVECHTRHDVSTRGPFEINCSCGHSGKFIAAPVSIRLNTWGGFCVCSEHTRTIQSALDSISNSFSATT